MIDQLRELESLANSDVSVNIVTLNIRKNPYSDSGRDIATRDYGINVSWHWVEDFNPYPVAGLYQEYWTFDGAFSTKLYKSLSTFKYLYSTPPLKTTFKVLERLS